MNEVFLSLGGNIGNSFQILTRAIHEIKRLPDIEKVEASRFYQTKPVGGIIQRDFINCVVRFHTSLQAHHLIYFLQGIEKAFGKDIKEKNGPRTLDIDILFYGNSHYGFPTLTIPHPRWRERLFVLIPLSDLISTIDLLTEEGKMEKVDIQSCIRAFKKLDEVRLYG